MNAAAKEPLRPPSPAGCHLAPETPPPARIGKKLPFMGRPPASLATSARRSALRFPPRPPMVTT